MGSLAALNRELHEIITETTALLERADNPDAMNLAAQLPPKLVDVRDLLATTLNFTKNSEIQYPDTPSFVIHEVRAKLKNIYAEVSGLRLYTSDAGVWTTTSKILQRLIKFQCDLLDWETLQKGTLSSSSLPPPPPAVPDTVLEDGQSTFAPPQTSVETPVPVEIFSHLLGNFNTDTNNFTTLPLTLKRAVEPGQLSEAVGRPGVVQSAPCSARCVSGLPERSPPSTSYGNPLPPTALFRVNNISCDSEFSSDAADTNVVDAAAVPALPRADACPDAVASNVVIAAALTDATFGSTVPPTSGNFSSSSSVYPANLNPHLSPSSSKFVAPDSQRVAFLRWLRNFGFDGFGVSVFVHIILGVLVLTWVVATYSENPRDKYENFNTGAGSGSRGAKARVYEHKVQMKNAKNMVTSTPRLTSRNANSTMSLPEMPLLNMNLQRGLPEGSRSKGLGGGSGGGVGSEIGVGIGNGKNFVAKWVMGLKIDAKKIAVYLDSSDSMVPYLENVKAEIRSQYPDADVFEIKNIGISVKDNKVRGGRFYIFPKTKKSSSSSQSSNVRRAILEKNPSTLKLPAAKSARSREAALKKWEDNFESGGSVGAWMDIMLFEGYDALVVFSDFQGGVRQMSASGKKIYVEAYKAEKLDIRRPADKAWEREWIERCKDRERGPRIYLFSIQVEPQEIWQKCVEASGGAVKKMPELRRKSKAPPNAAHTQALAKYSPLSDE